MLEKKQEFVSEIVLDAEGLLSRDDEANMFDEAVHSWADANEISGAPHPSLQGLREFLQHVIRDVVDEITTKYQDITVITLSLVTETLLVCLAEQYGWTEGMASYRIPLKLLTALIYKKILAHF